MPDKVLASNERLTNGRPGWRDVLHAVEHSEERLLREIKRNSGQIAAISERIERLERWELQRQTREKTLWNLAGGARTVLGGVLGAIMALLGVGFL